jgi:hypothetical protein
MKRMTITPKPQNKKKTLKRLFGLASTRVFLVFLVFYCFVLALTAKNQTKTFCFFCLFEGLWLEKITKNQKKNLFFAFQ